MTMRRAVIAALAFLLCTSPARADNAAETLYRAHGDAVYQVQVIDLASGKKAGIGSGFQFSPDGLIATNYHVIAEAVQRPDGNRIEFLHDKGARGQLQVVTADVAHDLAILKMDKAGKNFLTLGASQMPKGAKLFSLGNPHDIGFTIIEGTHSGVAHDSFAGKIHFSGSLNPGMSGGPAIDGDGRVVGINVATAGNQISFLVPVEHLRALNAGRNRGFSGNADAAIEAQLLKSQAARFRALTARKWESAAFGPVTAPGRIHPALKCWGGKESRDQDPFEHFVSVCGTEDNLFLDNGFDTGGLGYRYDYITAKDGIGLARFYSYYESAFRTPAGDSGNAGEDNVTNYACDSGFTDVAGFRWKSNLCLRRYKKYPALIDMYLNMAMVGEGKTGFIVTLDAQGLSRQNALDLARRFMSAITARAEDAR